MLALLRCQRWRFGNNSLDSGDDVTSGRLPRRSRESVEILATDLNPAADINCRKPTVSDVAA